MTASGDFLPAEDDQQLEQLGPTYPTAFGVEFTPKIQAILLGLLGIGGAFAIYNFLVQPVVEERQSLEAQVAEKELQVEQQEASLQEIAELRAELDQALQQRVEIYSLLGDQETLDTLLLDINQQIQNSNASIEDVLRTDFDRLDSGQLAALGLNREQVQQVRTRFAEDPVLQRLLYTSELINYSPGPATIVTDGPPELSGKLQEYSVDISMQALFPQTLSILRNLERLEPLVVVRDLQQGIASPPSGASEEDLVGVSRLLDTTFTLDVLVPAIDPAEPPAPPAPEEGEEGAEGEEGGEDEGGGEGEPAE
jgi:type IV pilus assembly protein PilO